MSPKEARARLDEFLDLLSSGKPVDGVLYDLIAFFRDQAQDAEVMQEAAEAMTKSLKILAGQDK